MDDGFILVDPDQIRIVNLLYKNKRLHWSDLVNHSGIDNENLFGPISSLRKAGYVEKNKGRYYLTDRGKKYMDRIEKI
jgi:DNA-binding MarR family transcriptional regulator